MTAEHKERQANLPFFHSFSRYFTDKDGKSFDRLQLVLQHGVVSKKTATELEIPFTPRIEGGFTNVLIQDNLVFVYKTAERTGFPIPGNGDIILFFDESIKTFTPSRIMSSGEACVIDKIPPEHIREIRLSSEHDTNDVRQMVEKFIPEQKNIKITTS